MDATNSPDVPGAKARLVPWVSLAIVAALILAYLVIVSSLRRPPIGTQGPVVGRHLPHFRLEPLTGDSAAVSEEDLLGHVTLVNFWGTWCGPCVRELPHIVELSEHFRSRPDFRIYAVSCGSDADADLEKLRDTTAEFLASNKVRLATYADPGAVSRQALSMAEGHAQFEFGYPTNIVMDRQGAIRGLWRGYHPAVIDEMRELITRLLDESTKPIEQATTAEPAENAAQPAPDQAPR